MKRRSLLTVDEKLDESADDIVMTRVCQSKIFKGMVYVYMIFGLLVILAITVGVSFSDLESAWIKDGLSTRLIVLVVALFMLMGFVLPVACCLPFSQKLS